MRECRPRCATREAFVCTQFNAQETSAAVAAAASLGRALRARSQNRSDSQPHRSGKMGEGVLLLSLPLLSPSNRCACRAHVSHKITNIITVLSGQRGTLAQMQVLSVRAPHVNRGLESPRTHTHRHTKAQTHAQTHTARRTRHTTRKSLTTMLSGRFWGGRLLGVYRTMRATRAIPQRGVFERAKARRSGRARFGSGSTSVRHNRPSLSEAAVWQCDTILSRPAHDGDVGSGVANQCVNVCCGVCVYVLCESVRSNTRACTYNCKHDVLHTHNIYCRAHRVGEIRAHIFSAYLSPS